MRGDRVTAGLMVDGYGGEVTEIAGDDSSVRCCEGNGNKENIAGVGRFTPVDLCVNFLHRECRKGLEPNDTGGRPLLDRNATDSIPPSLGGIRMPTTLPPHLADKVKRMLSGCGNIGGLQTECSSS